MKIGICNISIVPLRKEKSQKSEMVSQLLYGETFQILESSNDWSHIKMKFDDYKGWIKKKCLSDAKKFSCSDYLS